MRVMRHARLSLMIEVWSRAVHPQMSGTDWYFGAALSTGCQTRGRKPSAAPPSRVRRNRPRVGLKGLRYFLGFLGFLGIGAAARGTARLPARPFRCPLPLPLLTMKQVSGQGPRSAMLRTAQRRTQPAWRANRPSHSAALRSFDSEADPNAIPRWVMTLRGRLIQPNRSGGVVACLAAEIRSSLSSTRQTT